MSTSSEDHPALTRFEMLERGLIGSHVDAAIFRHAGLEYQLVELPEYPDRLFFSFVIDVEYRRALDDFNLNKRVPIRSFVNVLKKTKYDLTEALRQRRAKERIISRLEETEYGKQRSLQTSQPDTV